MDKILNNQTPRRPQADVAAEGMWRIAAGESCEQCWEELPECQKEWWRRCATEAFREWSASHCKTR
jgi:hypothetical protein